MSKKGSCTKCVYLRVFTLFSACLNSAGVSAEFVKRDLQFTRRHSSFTFDDKIAIKDGSQDPPPPHGEGGSDVSTGMIDQEDAKRVASNNFPRGASSEMESLLDRGTSPTVNTSTSLKDAFMQLGRTRFEALLSSPTVAGLEQDIEQLSDSDRRHDTQIGTIQANSMYIDPKNGEALKKVKSDIAREQRAKADNAVKIAAIRRKIQAELNSIKDKFVKEVSAAAEVMAAEVLAAEMMKIPGGN